MSEARVPNPITNKTIWDMAKVIVDRQKAAKDIDFKKVDTNSLEEDWFDWIEEILFEGGEVIQKPLKSKIDLDHFNGLRQPCCQRTGLAAVIN